MKKISYSAWKKYITCPKMYEYHYNERLRPTGTSSALVFGTAVDTALNELLLNDKEPVEIFRDAFKWEDMDGVEFDDRDLDKDLVGDANFDSDRHAAWASLRVKGRLVLEAYIREFFPLIEEVESVQKDLPDRPGVLDAVVKLRGLGRILIDHKTSIRPYNPNALGDDTQLALYADSLGIKQAGYVVLIKSIPKIKVCSKCSFDGTHVRHHTCPQIVAGNRCRGSWNTSVSQEGLIQVITGEVPEVNKQLITQSISETERAITAGAFPRNLGACGKIYGKPCPYINKCWKNSDDGLEYKKQEEK